ncbi:MAG: zinc ABC transporter substrate-binding protein [Nitrospirae bacterium]|nr:zinc ABC transporter substrate-binding protein [Nitrospirota bacterium]
MAGKRLTFTINAAVAIIAVTLLIPLAASGGIDAPGVRQADTDIRQADTGVVTVAASFYHLAHFAQQVGDGGIKVTNITPNGVEPHEFEPTPKDVRGIYKSRVFVFNGAGIDAWAEKLSRELAKSGVITLNVSSNITMRTTGQKNDYTDSRTVNHNESHKMAQDSTPNKTFDPHFWLDPVLAQKEVEAIRDVLVRASPQKAALFYKNAASYVEKLKALDEKYREGLKNCRLRDIVVTHSAFSYLAARYGFKTIPLTGISPVEDPSARKLGEISGLVKNKNIKYIFFETLVSPRLAKTIATETGASTLPLNPIEGLTQEDVKKGSDYISLMDDNLKNLRVALSCQ